MKYFNLYYIVAIVSGLAIFLSNHWMGQEALYFYGFAENKETEINFNYPVLVDEILVTPGQAVKAGDPLLKLKRVKAKEKLADQPFRMDELRAKANLWRNDLQGKLSLAQSKKEFRKLEYEGQIEKLEEERKYRASLFKDLKSVETTPTDYAPLVNRIKQLEKEKSEQLKSLDQEIATLQRELNLGKNPYEIEIKRLAAEQNFELDNSVIEVELKAPSDGVIGNIYCKRAEHIPSFKTLIIFYEPNPTFVKGYVYEDQILELAVSDSLLIRSTKDENIYCKGVVNGMGSRIVEIPERLRKIPDIKTYGREVLVSIPPQNSFLQKEKVGLEIIE